MEVDTGARYVESGGDEGEAWVSYGGEGGGGHFCWWNVDSSECCGRKMEVWKNGGKLLAR